MCFEAEIEGRSAADYADFFTPCLASDALVLDCGCGIATITSLAHQGMTTSIDRRFQRRGMLRA